MTVMSCENCGNHIVNNIHGTQCLHCGWKVGEGIEIKPSIPVYKFRCPSDCTDYGYGRDGLKFYGVLRYAEGNWIPDDGEPDLAFVGYTPGGWKGGAPIFYGVELPWQISCFHPNNVAYNSACNKCAEINSCASGRTVQPERCLIQS